MANDTRERYNRFPDDLELRKHGWRILSRPNRGEPRWVNPYGIEMTQSEAMETIRLWREQRRQGT